MSRSSDQPGDPAQSSDGSGFTARDQTARERTSSLWLTTYAQLAWNRAYYERFGFVTVAEASCGPELRGVLEAQRAALPAPEQRVAMRKSWAAAR